MKRGVALLAFVLALAIVGVWVSHGMHMATLTERLVEKTVIDDFGDEEIVQDWVPTFELGLDIAIPAGGGLFGLAGLLIFLDRRARRTDVSS